MTAKTRHSDTLAHYARMAPVIPVVTIEDPALAVPLARTLAEAGLPVVEVTLRTRRALAAIEAIARDVPDVIVAAGTVHWSDQINNVVDAGAHFIVTPGMTEHLRDQLAVAPIPAMPGCATVSEALSLYDHGFGIVKFFPAGPSGGVGWLKAVSAPIPFVSFCPTGGIDLKSAPDYLALSNVVCVGGSWMVPKEAVAAGDWATIGRLAREAASLR